MDYSNDFNGHFVQFLPAFSGASISEMAPENFPVIEPLEKCFLMAANSCQKFLEFCRVFISHHHNLARFAFISTISNKSIALSNLKIQVIMITIFFFVFLFASPENNQVMHSCFEGSSERYYPSFIDIKAGFILLLLCGTMVRMEGGEEQRICHTANKDIPGHRSCFCGHTIYHLDPGKTHWW